MTNPKMRASWSRAAVVSMAAFALVALSACSSGQETASPAPEGADDGQLTIAFLQKQGDQQYFIDEADGAKSSFGDAVSDAPEVITVGTDNSATDAQDKAGAIITANAGVKHWVVWGCNDENVTGVVTALQNSGVAPADINGVGLGAYLTCKDWKAGQDTGNKSALFISGVEVGKAAVNSMIDFLVNDVALPPKTIANTEIVDATNWEEKGVVCT